MVRLPRLALGTVTGIALVAVFAHLSGRWGTDLSTNAPEEALRQFRAEVYRRDILESRNQALRVCSENKHRVVEALLAGDVTLLEAAQEFGRLQDVSGFSREPLRMCFRGSSEEETLCRHVLAWVRAELNDRPAERTAACDRLEKELQQYLETTGAGAGS
jgi:hypothetical protein